MLPSHEKASVQDWRIPIPDQTRLLHTLKLSFFLSSFSATIEALEIKLTRDMLWTRSPLVRFPNWYECQLGSLTPQEWLYNSLVIFILHWATENQWWTMWLEYLLHSIGDVFPPVPSFSLPLPADHAWLIKESLVPIWRSSPHQFFPSQSAVGGRAACLASGEWEMGAGEREWREIWDAAAASLAPPTEGLRHRQECSALQWRHTSSCSSPSSNPRLSDRRRHTVGTRPSRALLVARGRPLERLRFIATEPPLLNKNRLAHLPPAGWAEYLHAWESNVG